MPVPIKSTFDALVQASARVANAPPMAVRMSVSHPSSRKMATVSPVVAEKANIIPFDDANPLEGLS